MPEPPDPPDPREKRILNASERVLKSVGEMKDLERRKRKERVSTPPYHDLADEAEAKSREIFMAAHDETDAANDMESGSRSIDEIAADEDQPRTSTPD